MSQTLHTIISAWNQNSNKAPLAAIPFGVAEIDSELPTNGLSRGALHEFFYNDPLDPSAVARTIPALLAYNAHAALASLADRSRWQREGAPLLHTLWIGKRAWPAPPALAGLTSSSALLSASLFEHSLFIDPPNDASTLWAIDCALRCSAINLIVAACPRVSRTTTQRLTLAAKKNGTTAILLRAHSDLGIPSCATSRWSLAPVLSPHETPSWTLNLKKLRGGLLMRSEWIVSINAPDPFKGSLQALCATKLPERVDTTPLITSINMPARAIL